MVVVVVVIAVVIVVVVVVVRLFLNYCPTQNSLRAIILSVKQVEIETERGKICN